MHPPAVVPLSSRYRPAGGMPTLAGIVSPAQRPPLCRKERGREGGASRSGPPSAGLDLAPLDTALRAVI